jgi:hypothetical protein
VLHLTGTRAVDADYERLGQPAVSLDDIRHFRQLASKAPGHPEYHWVSGVETTTSPLGQGVATSVGMGIAQKWLASRYNQPGFEIFNYNIYAVCGAGCLMEGVASEAASLAGHLGLDNLCWVYNNNHITIEGNTRLTFTAVHAEDAHVLGQFLRDVITANESQRNFRLFGPDETVSNRLGTIFEVTQRQWDADTVSTRTSARAHRLAGRQPRAARSARRTEPQAQGRRRRPRSEQILRRQCDRLVTYRASWGYAGYAGGAY